MGLSQTETLVCAQTGIQRDPTVAFAATTQGHTDQRGTDAPASYRVTDSAGPLPRCDAMTSPTRGGPPSGGPASLSRPTRHASVPITTSPATMLTALRACGGRSSE